MYLILFQNSQLKGKAKFKDSKSYSFFFLNYSYPLTLGRLNICLTPEIYGTAYYKNLALQIGSSV